MHFCSNAFSVKICKTPLTRDMYGVRRGLFTLATRCSNVGKVGVRVPEEVTCAVEDIPREFCKTFTKGADTYVLLKQFVVKGPKGILKLQIPPFVNFENREGKIFVTVNNPSNKIERSMWGTTRALVQNNVIGASEGHIALVKFVGTGYRALIEEKNGSTYVGIKVGFPYTPQLKVPTGLKVSLPNPARLLIEGIDKQQVKLFAARIREFKKPEPYKGKGIFVDDQKITLKERKIK